MWQDLPSRRNLPIWPLLQKNRFHKEGTVNLIVTGIIAGIFGTVVMDVLNILFARVGVITRIEVRGIGRMAVGWMHGRFSYRHPNQMQQVENELCYGYLAHFAIGIGLAFPYLLGWHFLIGGPASPAWALVYGVGTTIVSYFYVYPCLGLGLFGRRSPDGIKAPLSSLANHLFYGIGLASVTAMV